MRVIIWCTLLLGVSFSTSSIAQLPESWFGHYIGELKAINLAGKESVFHMELSINQRTDSSYNFTIVYGEDSLRQERAYQLIPKSTGIFVLDEKNGIELDMSLCNNRLVSVFDVNENLLHVSYIRTKKGIRYELTSSIKGEEVGGNTTSNGETIPLVKSYTSVAFQFAELKKQK